MTPEKEMKATVEAAGGCWHEWHNGVIGYNTANHKRVYECKKCGKGGTDHVHLSYLNPSPTDLNELFRLAEKLGCTDIDFEWVLGKWICEYTTSEFIYFKDSAFTPADALRKALYQAVTPCEK